MSVPTPPYREPARRRQQPQQAAAPGYVIDRSAGRVLSALAHGAIAFGLFGVTFPIALAISGIIWLYGKRSPDVRFHAEQAGCYQCSVLLINFLFVVLLGVASGFSIFNLFQGRTDWSAGWGFGLGLILFLLWFTGTIVFGLVAAALVLLGVEFKYPIIGDRFKKG
jgi:uncharacterized Tic20 family protein